MSLTVTIARSFHSRFFGLLSSLLEKQHFSPYVFCSDESYLQGRTDSYNLGVTSLLARGKHYPGLLNDPYQRAVQVWFSSERNEAEPVLQ